MDPNQNNPGTGGGMPAPEPTPSAPEPTAPEPSVPGPTPDMGGGGGIAAGEKCVTCGNSASGGTCTACGQGEVTCTCQPAPTGGGEQPTGAPVV